MYCVCVVGSNWESPLIRIKSYVLYVYPLLCHNIYTFVFSPFSPSFSLPLSLPPSLPLFLSLLHAHAVIHGYQLRQGEQAVSLTSCTLGESADTRNTFYVVGTAFVDVGEKEPTQGRVLVFLVTDSKHKIEMRLQIF